MSAVLPASPDTAIPNPPPVLTPATNLNLEQIGDTQKLVGGPEVPRSAMEGLHAVLLSSGVSINPSGVLGMEKLISYKDFLDILTASSDLATKKVKESSILKTRLPEGTFYLGMTEKTLEISIWYPEAVRKIGYHHLHGGTAVPCITPGLIFSHKLVKTPSAPKEWAHNQTYITCTNKPFSAMPDRFVHSTAPAQGIFRLPFTNTHTDNQICWGYNSFPKRIPDNNLSLLHGVYAAWVGGIFNNDLGISSVAGRYSIQDWFAKLGTIAKGPDPKFPYTDLNDFIR